MKKTKLIICLYLLICCGSILASDLVFADSLDLQYDPTEGEVMREWLLATSSESDLDLTLANPGDKALVEQKYRSEEPVKNNSCKTIISCY